MNPGTDNTETTGGGGENARDREREREKERKREKELGKEFASNVTRMYVKGEPYNVPDMIETSYLYCIL